MTPNPLLARLTALRERYGVSVDNYLIGALSAEADNDMCVEAAFERSLKIAETCAVQVAASLAAKEDAVTS